MSNLITLAFSFLCTQHQSVKGADGTFMQVAELNSPFDDQTGRDAQLRVRFMAEDLAGTLTPGKHYKVTLEEVAVVELEPVSPTGEPLAPDAIIEAESEAGEPTGLHLAE